MTIQYQDNILEMARQALQRPDNFAYFGDLDDSVWGRMFAQHRDSDALERSNWEVISSDLATRFPDDWTVEGSSHWAVGWVDEGRIRVLKDPHGGIIEENLTDAFRAAVAWKEKLDRYPVADEEHYSALESEEFTEYVLREASWYFGRVRPDDDMPKDFPDKFLGVLADDHCSCDDLSDSVMENAARYIIKGETCEQ